MSDIIKFSYNWNNKLNCKAFTTLRLHNQTKYRVGKLFEIELNGKPMGKAILQEVRTASLKHLNEFVCFIDTGYSRAQTIGMLQKMYPKIDLNKAYFDFCLLVYEQPTKQKSEPEQLNLPYKD